MSMTLEWRSMSLQEKFDLSYQIVSESGCWIWTGAINTDGYGSIQHYGKIYLAHRLSRAFSGDDITDFIVCHTCDTPLCVNPDHLYCGTQSDNMKDMVSRNRQSRKIPKDAIESICSSNKRLSDIADEYGVSVAAISKIRRANGACRYNKLKSNPRAAEPHKSETGA